MSKATPSYALAPSSVQGPMRFLFEGLEVRAVDRDGRPWFVGKDVSQVLGHENSKQALSRLPDSERASVKVPDALGREQATTIISIAGVFRLAMTSRVDGAARFQAWVTDEVLPQIYTRGAYTPQPEPSLTTREADLSALTDAVSAIVPALTAITTTLAALGARVAALEASRPAPHPTRTGPDFYALLATHFEPDAGTWMTNEEVRAVLRPGAWNKSEVIALNKALVRLGAPERRRHGNIRAFGVRRIALPAPRRESGPFDRPALPAPRSEPPAEWNGVPVEEILNDNLHLAGVGCWLYGAVADPDVTPKGAQPDPSRVFRPGVLVSGTRIHPGPGAYAWTSFDWLHVHISADIKDRMARSRWGVAADGEGGAEGAQGDRGSDG